MTKPRYLLLPCLIALLTVHAGVAAPADDAPIANQTQTRNHFAIVPTASQIVVLVRRASVLRRLGHNHIVSTTNLVGSVYRPASLDEGRIEFTLAVADFRIDDPALRAAEGEDFASVPTERDIEGTRRNMLGRKLLDSANYPAVQVLGTELGQTKDGWTIQITLTVKDAVLVKRVPLQLELGPDQIRAEGTLQLTHKELGLKPFSVMLGALRVADGLEVRFSILAIAEPCQSLDACDEHPAKLN